MFASLHTAQLTYRRVQKGGLIERIAGLTRLAMSARAQRRALARLDDMALADIGLTRAEAQCEAARAAWDVPTAWRR